MRVQGTRANGFILLLLCWCLPSVGEDPWMFRGNPAHSGVYEGAGLAQFGGVRWKFHTGGMVIGSAAVSEGKVYFGSTDGNLYAVNADSGALRWKFDAKSRIPSSPAVAEKVVYFGAYDGNFYAVDAATGTLKWKFQTEGERRFAGKHLHGVQPVSETMPDPFDCYLSSPVVWKGAVLFRQWRWVHLLAERSVGCAEVEVQDRRCGACVARSCGRYGVFGQLG